MEDGFEGDCFKERSLWKLILLMCYLDKNEIHFVVMSIKAMKYLRQWVSWDMREKIYWLKHYQSRRDTNIFCL